MAQKTYIPIFRLATQHSYYANGVERAFRFHPSPLTAGKLKKVDLRLTERAGEYWLYLGVLMDANGNPLNAEIEINPTLLTFSIVFDNPQAANDFYCYTNLPLTSNSKQVFVFAHEWSRGEQGAPPATTIQVDADQHQVSVRSVVFQPELPSHRPLKLEVTNAAKRVVVGEIVQREKAGDPPFVLDLREEDWGRYELAINKTSGEEVVAPEEFCLLAAPDNQQVWGLVQLSIPKVSFSATAPMKPEEVPSLKLSLDNRATQWRYHLINHNNLNFDGLRLSSENESVSYKESALEKSPEGVTSKVTLTLDEPIKLMSEQAQDIKLDILKQNGGDQPDVFVSLALPTPSPNQIKLKRTDGVLTAFSDMYVYI